MVVYSIIDSESFRKAEEILQYLNTESGGNSRARILVGNKVDLERSRQVSAEEGKQLAHCYDAKFIETSAGLEHNVDELLVGVLKQILLRQHTERKTIQLKVSTVGRVGNIGNIGSVESVGKYYIVLYSWYTW